MQNIDFPFHIDSTGRTAITNHSDHIRDMICQILFTSPGERVNRPTFGCGLNQLVFEPNSFELIATLEFLIRSSLQQWMGELIEVASVKIEINDSTLTILVVYAELIAGNMQTAVFTKTI